MTNVTDYCARCALGVCLEHRPVALDVAANELREAYARLREAEALAEENRKAGQAWRERAERAEAALKRLYGYLEAIGAVNDPES